MTLSSSGAQPEATFWKNKRVLLTGHTGFKGAWLALWLSQMGAKVSALSLPPTTQPNLYSLLHVDSLVESAYIDIRDAAALKAYIQNAQPEILLHLAAQPLVRESYRSPLETFSTNIMGTAHVLDALRGLDSIRVAVIVTTDKVYLNREHTRAYCETDSLGGYDPYSASKAGAEIVIASYRDSFLAEQGVAVASARAGNVIGGGDWSPDRLIPDALRAWSNDQVLVVRRPNAIRPWQHVIEPLCGYLVLAERLWRAPQLSSAYNFGPADADTVSVRTAIEIAQKKWLGARVDFKQQDEGPHEAGLLMLDASKAETALGIKPQWTLQHAIERTVHWYRGLASGDSALDLCQADLDAYTKMSVIS